jgi:hypothetical protein
MKRIILLIVLLLCYRVSFCQPSEADNLSYLFRHTSLNKKYLIILKNSKKKDIAVWSDYLLEYFADRKFSRTESIQIIVHKIIANDTFDIDKSKYQDLSMHINTDTVKSLMKKTNNLVSNCLKIYFENQEIKPEYLPYRWEIAKLLWTHKVFLCVTSDQLSPIPRIDNFQKKYNTQDVNTKTENTLKEEPVFFYFPQYDFFVNIDSDTSLLNNYIRSQTDQQVLNTTKYYGPITYLKVLNKKNDKKLIVSLYDEDKSFVREENYSYSDNISIKTDSVFDNFSSQIREVKRKIIIPVMQGNISK